MNSHSGATRILVALAVTLLAVGCAPGATVSPSPAAATQTPSPAVATQTASPAAGTPTSVPTPSPTLAATPTATSPGSLQTIHVLEPARNVSQVSVGSLTGCTNPTACQGDYVLGDDPLLDATTRQEVGSLQFECFRVDTDSSLFHCPGNTITLTGRGQIVYTEDVHFASGYTPDPWPITGGTGEFLGTTGFVTSPADSTYTEGGDFVITFTTPAVPPAAPPSPTNQAQTIHVALHSAGNTVYVPVGSLTGCTNTTSCQGDYRLGVVPLVDAESNEGVGTLVYVEFVTDTGDSLFHSPGNTIRLTGRGEIVFTETLYDDGSGRAATAPIIGGTGEFLGAKGFVVSTSLPTGGDFVITITGQTPTPSQAPSTIHLTEHPTNVGDIPVASLTACTGTSGCRGDYMVGDDPMFDAANGAEVGTLVFACFLVDPASGLFHCPGATITLTGRGPIVFTEKFDGSSQTSPIAGGADEFLGATGTVTSQLPPSGNGDFVITITN